MACLTGCDNVGENLSVPEIEQQNMSVLWTNASEDLDLKESSATEMKSVPLQNSGRLNILSKTF